MLNGRLSAGLSENQLQHPAFCHESEAFTKVIAASGIDPVDVSSSEMLSGFDDEAEPFDSDLTVQTLEPVIIPSIAARVGMNNFVYLRGCSGKRYVFSAIERDRLPLYRDAIVALVDTEANAPLWTGPADKFPEFGTGAGSKAGIFIHLLACSTAERQGCLTDLRVSESHYLSDDKARPSISSFRSRMPMERNCSTVWKI